MIDELQLELASTGRRKGRLTAVLIVFIVWSIFVVGYPTVNDRFFYSIEHPVKVLEANGEYVRLEFERHALWSMAGTCANELHCDSVQELPPTGCPLEAGSSTFDAKFPLLHVAINGGGGFATCVYRGTVQYAPFGFVGPLTTHLWASEPFNVLRGK